MFISLSWLTATTIAITNPNTNQIDRLGLAESMDEAIRDYDPFYAPDEKDELCGPLRQLDTIPDMFRVQAESMPDRDWTIMDDVVMSYWESRDDDRYWTPLCVARYDLVPVGH